MTVTEADLAQPFRPVRKGQRSHRAAIPVGAAAIAGDLNRPESLSAALAGVRGVFLLPGYRDMPGVLAEMRRAGVGQVDDSTVHPIVEELTGTSPRTIQQWATAHASAFR